MSARKPKPLSEGEETLALHLRARGTPLPVREFRFHPERRWKFDFAWPARKLAVECEGGIFSGGRHTRGAGYAADLVKYNEAALAGWCVLRFSTDQIRDGSAIEVIRRALAQTNNSFSTEGNQ